MIHANHTLPTFLPAEALEAEDFCRTLAQALEKRDILEWLQRWAGRNLPGHATPEQIYRGLHPHLSIPKRLQAQAVLLLYRHDLRQTEMFLAECEYVLREDFAAAVVHALLPLIDQLVCAGHLVKGKTAFLHYRCAMSSQTLTHAIPLLLTWNDADAFAILHSMATRVQEETFTPSPHQIRRINTTLMAMLINDGRPAALRFLTEMLTNLSADLSLPVTDANELRAVLHWQCPELSRAFCGFIQAHPSAINSHYWADQDQNELRQAVARGWLDLQGIIENRGTSRPLSAALLLHMVCRIGSLDDLLNVLDTRGHTPSMADFVKDHRFLISDALARTSPTPEQVERLVALLLKPNTVGDLAPTLRNYLRQHDLDSWRLLRQTTGTKRTAH